MEIYLTDTNSPPTGHLTLRVIDEQAGCLVRQFSKKNLIMYAGADLMARALAGQGNMIDYLYLEFTNSTVPTDPLIGSPRDVGIAYYNSLAAPKDYLRIPITAIPVVSATGASYLTNSVMFSGMSAGQTLGRHGVAFTNSTSIVYGAALATKYNASADPSQDIVFSRNYFVGAGQPITKVANQQVAAFWSINFY